jgi:hypothetical protein
MADAETPEGMRLLYDLLVKSAEFPGESPHNLKNLYNWGEKMKALHHLLSSYHDEDYKREYRSAMKRIMEISREYPSPKYISEGYDGKRRINEEQCMAAAVDPEQDKEEQESHSSVHWRHRFRKIPFIHKAG